ncbi:hypothetical protein V1512DRAFT_276734 [Lipomyces arxii]|uniref:uncharacterized protein n=1 Tax=Lipomyces arxii TaxID=56418 RepID=UPI0034CE474A
MHGCDAARPEDTVAELRHAVQSYIFTNSPVTGLLPQHVQALVLLLVLCYDGPVAGMWLTTAMYEFTGVRAERIKLLGILKVQSCFEIFSRRRKLCIICCDMSTSTAKKSSRPDLSPVTDLSLQSLPPSVEQTVTERPSVIYRVINDIARDIADPVRNYWAGLRRRHELLVLKATHVDFRNISDRSRVTIPREAVEFEARHRDGAYLRWPCLRKFAAIARSALTVIESGANRNLGVLWQRWEAESV